LGIADKKKKRIFKKRQEISPKESRKAVAEAVHFFLVTAEDFGTRKKYWKKQATTDEPDIEDSTRSARFRRPPFSYDVEFVTAMKSYGFKIIFSSRHLLWWSLILARYPELGSN
jgi:hypothetical protein